MDQTKTRGERERESWSYFIRLHILFRDWFQFSGWDSIQKTVSMHQEAGNNVKGCLCIPLQNREVEINLSISDKLLQIRFTDTTDRIDIRCPTRSVK